MDLEQLSHFSSKQSLKSNFYYTKITTNVWNGMINY